MVETINKTGTEELEAETGEEQVARERSPSFPFIPLDAAIERLIEFDAYSKRHPVPVNKVGLAWGMAPKTSQSDQTIAALRSFGLVEYQGTGDRKEAVLTPDARTYLRAQQDEIKRQVLKRAALYPKNIMKFWSIWGAARPSDEVCLDKLILDNRFSDKGARSFLKVYDATIAYANLSESDKVASENENGDNGNHGENGDSLIPEQFSNPSNKGKGKLMTGERELTTGLLSKDAGFRLIVNGQIGVKEIERLIKKLELDKEILADTDNESAN